MGENENTVNMSEALLFKWQKRKEITHIGNMMPEMLFLNVYLEREITSFIWDTLLKLCCQ